MGEGQEASLAGVGQGPGLPVMVGLGCGPNAALENSGLVTQG